MKRTRLDDNAYIIDFEDGEELLECAAILNNMRKGFMSKRIISASAIDYPRMVDEKKEDIWRQVKVDALATAIVELAKGFPDEFVSEVITDTELVELIRTRRASL